jgi:hypothetical protein
MQQHGIRIPQKEETEVGRVALRLGQVMVHEIADKQGPDMKTCSADRLWRRGLVSSISNAEH